VYQQRSLGINVNLWWGAVLLVFGALMLLFGRKAQGAADAGVEVASPILW